MKISARNQLKGKIAEIKEGAVNGVVVLEMDCGQKVTSTISMAAIQELGLKKGMDAVAVIKATDVMMAIED